MGVEIVVRTGVRGEVRAHQLKKNLKKAAKKLLNVLAFEESELSILLTTDSEISELNYHYRGKDSATDVLSFSQQDQGGEESMTKNLGCSLLGDVVISIERAKKQSESLGVTLAQEVLRLVIHGVLHLLGFEHEDVSDEVAQEMRDKESELYATLVNEVP